MSSHALDCCCSLYHLSRHGRAQGLDHASRSCPAAAKTPTRVERLPNDLPKLKRWLERVARDGRAARVLRGERRGVRAAPRAARVGLRVRGDRAVAHPEAAGRAAQARQARRRASWRGSIAPASSPRCASRARPRSACATSCAAARRSSARSSSRATTSSSSSPGAASCSARARTGARRTCSGSQHLTTERLPARAGTTGSCFASITRCSLYKLQRRDELDRQIEQLALSCRRSRRWSRRLQCFRGISLHCGDGAGDGDRRLAPLRAARRSSPATSGSSRARTRAATASASARSRRRATATVGTCSCRRRGAIGIARRRASISSGGSRASRRR